MADLTHPPGTRVVTTTHARAGKITAQPSATEARYLLEFDDASTGWYYANEFCTQTATPTGVVARRGDYRMAYLTLAQLTKLTEDIGGYYKEFGMSDNVNSPAHYIAGNIECIDAIESALTPEEFRGYCKGNALKYIWREKHKGGDESIRKAIWYLDRLVGEKVG